jgi:hypothetical protein
MDKSVRFSQLWLWNIIMSCSQVKVTRWFGGICCLHLQDWIISQHEAELSLPLASCWFLTSLILQPWRWRQYIPPKCYLFFNGLHNVIFQKIETVCNHSCENLKSHLSIIGVFSRFVITQHCSNFISWYMRKTNLLQIWESPEVHN